MKHSLADDAVGSPGVTARTKLIGWRSRAPIRCLPPPEWLIVGLDVPDLDDGHGRWSRALAGRVGALKIGPGAVHPRRAGGDRSGARALRGAARKAGVPRPEVARHSQHRGRSSLPRGCGPGRVDGHRTCTGRPAASACWPPPLSRGNLDRPEGAAAAGDGRGTSRCLMRPGNTCSPASPAHPPTSGPPPGVDPAPLVVAEQVERLAALAERGGADGLVTSGHEVAALHARWPQFNLVVPGVRPRWLTAAGTAPADDQRRTATPVSTLAAGASHVVIARPIITHSDPIQAVHLTVREVATAG